MKQLKIKEVFHTIRNGANLKQDKTSGGVPITRIETIVDSTIDLERMGFAGIKDDSYSEYYLQDGDILMSHINSVSHLGKVAIFENRPEKIIHGMNLLCFRPDKELLFPKFAFYFFRTPNFINSIKKITKKSVNQASFNISSIEELTIFLPEKFEDQIKIATILSMAEALIKLRTDSVRLVDDFLKSTFLKMFGNPFRNEKGWEIIKFGDIIEDIIYGTSTPPKYEIEGIPFIRATNIKSGRISENSMVFISQAEADKISKCKLKEGDIIIVRSGANAGDSATIPKEYDGAYAAFDLIVKINKTSSIFYNELINSSYGKALIKPFTQRSAQPHLNSDQVKKLNFYYPPLELQVKFEKLYRKTEALKKICIESHSELEILYNSLSQNAFKGDLDLNKLVIDHIIPRSVGGSSDVSNLQAISKKENIKKGNRLSSELSLKEEIKKKSKSKITWESVSTQQIANWIREKYTGFYFNSEMILRFLKNEYVTYPYYFSSEELKTDPRLNEGDDLKSFIFSSISKENPYIHFEQVFYHAEKENIQLELTEEDYELFKDLSQEERSGIYFKILK